MTKKVLWNGKKDGRTHAPDCAWVAGCGLKYQQTLKLVDVKDVPPNTPKPNHGHPCGR